MIEAPHDAFAEQPCVRDDVVAAQATHDPAWPPSSSAPPHTWRGALQLPVSWPLRRVPEIASAELDATELCFAPSARPVYLGVFAARPCAVPLLPQQTSPESNGPRQRPSCGRHHSILRSGRRGLCHCTSIYLQLPVGGLDRRNQTWSICCDVAKASGVALSGISKKLREKWFINNSDDGIRNKYILTEHDGNSEWLEGLCGARKRVIQTYGKGCVGDWMK